MSTRRQFLWSCSTVCAGTVFAALGAWGVPKKVTQFRMLEELRFSTFAEQLNTLFHVLREGEPAVDLELIEAKQQATNPNARGMDAAYEKFSLIFSGPLEAPLEQKIHTFEQPRMGRFEIFIVPVLSKDPKKLHYQAIFNRPVK